MANDILRQVWPEWEIEGSPIGKGSYGVVYKAVRRDHNVESYAAIKVISIPSDSSEVDSLRSEGLDMNATRAYLQGIVNDFVSEIQLMESLKGVQNIVSVEDYKVVEKTDEIGWDIYIRMELLTSFNTYICDKKLTEEEVIKLGCDICTALEICSKRNIIHRDIKPENIFVNDFGYFKLGDFGIARKMENMTGGLSQKGTFNYMAPEVVNSSDYDARVDIYSLGIVLYRLLNGNRLPFLDTEKQILNPNERRNAVDRRIRGEQLSMPCEASPAMADLILRACAYDPNMRFASATEMKQALMSVGNGTYQFASSALDKTLSVRSAPSNYDKTVSVRRAQENYNCVPEQQVATFNNVSRKKNHLLIIITVAILGSIAFIGVGIFGVLGLVDYFTSDESKDAVTADHKEEQAVLFTLNPSTDITFTAVDEGYEQQAPCAITVKNDGAQQTGTLTISCTGTNPECFQLDHYSIDNIAAGDSSEFSVTPRTGLSAGTYTATINVQATDNERKSINVIFIVNKAKESQVTETPIPAAIDSFVPTIPSVTNDSILTVKASSTLVEEEYNLLHSADLVVDGKLDTGWVEGSPAQGISEYIVITLDRTSRVSGFTIYAGYHKSEELYAKNSRPKEMRIEFSDGTYYDCILYDAFGSQTVRFDTPKETNQVMFRIISVYPGTKYTDTVISEISLF